MKATQRQQEILLKLQELDHLCARLAKQNAELAARQELAAAGATREAAKDSYMAAQRELDARQMELARIESDVQLVEQREERDRLLLAQSVAAKEAQALQGELDLLRNRRIELEDRQLAAMEIVEAAQADFTQAEATLADLDSGHAAIAARLTLAEQEFAAELASLRAKRADLAVQVQGDLLECYEATRARSGIGAARLNGNVSAASGLALTPAELGDIKALAADEVAFCPSTGAILVRDSDQQQ